MFAKQITDSPSHWQTSCVGNDDAVIIYPNLNRHELFIRLVANAIEDDLSKSINWYGEFVNAHDALIVNVCLHVLCCQQVNNHVYLLKQTAMYFILIKYVGIVGKVSYLE